MKISSIIQTQNYNIQKNRLNKQTYTKTDCTKELQKYDIVSFGASNNITAAVSNLQEELFTLSRSNSNNGDIVNKINRFFKKLEGQPQNVQEAFILSRNGEIIQEVSWEGNKLSYKNVPHATGNTFFVNLMYNPHLHPWRHSASELFTDNSERNGLAFNLVKIGSAFIDFVENNLSPEAQEKFVKQPIFHNFVLSNNPYSYNLYEWLMHFDNNSTAEKLVKFMSKGFKGVVKNNE